MGTFPARRFAVAILTVAATVSAAVVVAGAPAAAIPGIQLVQSGSPAGPEPTKVAVAPCPDGQVVIDGGGSISGAPAGEVRLTGLRPLGGSFEATATTGTQEYAGDWSLIAYAICAPRSYSISIHSVTGPMSFQWWRGHTVDCPRGQRLIGAGAYLAGPNGAPPAGVALQIILPNPDLTHMNGSAYRVDDSYSGSWQLTVYATCADPLPGLVRVMNSGGNGASIATVACPRGTVLHGLGGAGNAAPGHLTLTQQAPIGNLSGALTTVAETGNGTPPAPWAPVSIAICAN